MNSLGYPAKYTALVSWESRDAGCAWGRGDAFRDFLKANPNDGLYTLSRPPEAYEMVLEVVNEGQEPAFVNLVDWVINPGQANAAGFERNRKEFFELRQQHSKNFVFGHLYRFLGNANQYLVCTSYQTLEDLRGAGVSPEEQEFARAHPTTEYINTPSVLERHMVVQRVER